jgi:hypothetical protein
MHLGLGVDSRINDGLFVRAAVIQLIGSNGYKKNMYKTSCMVGGIQVFLLTVWIRHGVVPVVIAATLSSPASFSPAVTV